MYLRANTLDDLLDAAFRLLLKSKMRVSPKKGATVEEQGVVLELTRPRARLSRASEKGHIFSCLGELFWYISCKQDLPSIQYYIKRYEDYAEPNGTIWGAYGPRIFGGERSQYEVVRDLLKARSATRKAVIQLFDREDIIAEHEDVPCTCTLQFLLRDGMLNLVVYMRSNDVFMGFPHDVFAFTMIQEILANDLGVRLGSYKHMVGSLHLYDRDREKVERYLNEGFQPTREMPVMPASNPWNDITKLFVVEDVIRKGGALSVLQALAPIAGIDPYWADFGRLFGVYALTRGDLDIPRERLKEVVGLRRSMSSDFYASYIRKRSKKLTQRVARLGVERRADEGESHQ
jgi:thymidylate synthase